MSPDLHPVRRSKGARPARSASPRGRFVAGVVAVALSFTVLAGCGSDGSSLNDDLRVALGDELADCLDDNLDDDMIDALNEDGIDFDVMSEATADAYAAALTVCQP